MNAVAARTRAGVLCLVLASSCGSSSPCTAPEMHLAVRYAERYRGHWVVGRGDTLTLPLLGDRFKLTDVMLDSARVVFGQVCHFKGTLVFRVPRDTLVVSWIAYPEQALVYGWPVELGPFAGVGVTRVGDSLAGEVLYDSRFGVQARPGATARFVAGRARD